MFRIFILFLSVTGFGLAVHAQNGVDTSVKSPYTISILTSEPGTELYSIFGHTAIRVINSADYSDEVYNYGTFDFNDPHFYRKFISGKLTYYLNVEPYVNFIYTYHIENRTVYEQVLKLTSEESNDIVVFLKNNAQPENRYYSYDFFYDNCTTRVRDVLNKFLHPQPQYNYVLPATSSFRDAIHIYLDKGKMYWSKLAIDILLGKPTDKIMTVDEQLFLPDDLMYALDSLQTPKNLVQQKSIVYTAQPNSSTHKFATLFSPTIVLAILFVILLLCNMLVSSKWVTVLNSFLVFLCGAMGCMVIYMWFFTNHAMTKTNYNILLFFPWYVIVAFFLNERNKFMQYYSAASMGYLIILGAVWFLLPQKLNTNLLWIVAILFVIFAKNYLQYVRRNKATNLQ